MRRKKTEKEILSLNPGSGKNSRGAERSRGSKKGKTNFRGGKEKALGVGWPLAG